MKDLLRIIISFLIGIVSLIIIFVIDMASDVSFLWYIIPVIFLIISYKEFSKI